MTESELEPSSAKSECAVLGHFLSSLLPFDPWGLTSSLSHGWEFQLAACKFKPLLTHGGVGAMVVPGHRHSRTLVIPPDCTDTGGRAHS